MAGVYIWHNFPPISKDKLAKGAITDSSNISAIFCISNFASAQALTLALGLSYRYINVNLQRASTFDLKLFV